MVHSDYSVDVQDGGRNDRFHSLRVIKVPNNVRRGRRFVVEIGRTGHLLSGQTKMVNEPPPVKPVSPHHHYSSEWEGWTGLGDGSRGRVSGKDSVSTHTSSSTTPPTQERFKYLPGSDQEHPHRPLVHRQVSPLLVGETPTTQSSCHRETPLLSLEYETQTKNKGGL